MSAHTKKGGTLRWWILTLLLIPLSVVASQVLFSETIPLVVGGQTIQVELADDTVKRHQGLMFRQEMADDHGMLFVFDDDAPRSFWMKNTFIPLSIAFIDANKKIVRMHDMAPNNSRKHYRSGKPARYALEVNQGLFKTWNVKVGDEVSFTLPEK